MKTTPFGILLLATLTGCAAPVPRQEPPVDRRAEETDPSDSYFPAGVFDEDHPAVDQKLRKFLAAKLQSLNEPSLFNTCAPFGETYRYVHSRSRANSSWVLRLQRLGDSKTLVAIRALDHSQKETVVPEDIWEQWIDTLAQIGYWHAPLMTGEQPLWIDGSTVIVVESCRKGVYLVRQVRPYQEPAILRRAIITFQKLAGWKLDPDGR